MSADRQSGIFLSPTRGLVEYDNTTREFREVDKDDERLPAGVLFPAPPSHTVFGDAYLLMSFLHESGMSQLLAHSVPDVPKRERLISHIPHGIPKDGSRIGCGDFIGKSCHSSIRRGQWKDGIPL